MASVKLHERRSQLPNRLGIATASYEGDYHAWTVEQAAALRAGRLSELDVQNLAEEIDDLGKAEFGKLSSSYRVILLHMLKWDHQPERRTRSWVGSIETHRIRLDIVLGDNPSLKGSQPEAIARGYREARVKAAAETGQDKGSFPKECPYSPDDIMNRAYEWPEH